MPPKSVSIPQTINFFLMQLKQSTRLFNHIRRFLPSICVLCNHQQADSQPICQACYALLTPLGPSCSVCAIPLPDTEDSCGSCCHQKPLIDRVISVYRYEEPLRTLLHLFKYQDGLYLTSFLVALMLQAPIDKKPSTCVVPIPLHRTRLRGRGYNQAALLAKKLSQILDLPYQPQACKRIVNTKPQAGLNALSRRENLKHAFEAKPISYQRVILIDDLFTTGNTANEVAKTLKNQGVQQVELWCCARAIF